MYYHYGYYMDPTYILVLIGLALTLLASGMVNSTYAKYERIRSSAGMTGADAARRILLNAGITDVQVVHTPGRLTDHYNPSKRTVFLSDATYNSTSVAAIGVAAHECGHAVQHDVGYVPLQLRSALVPVATIGLHAGIPLILIGILMSYNQTLITIGIWAFSLAVLFQLVTLPVEFNASRRALAMLGEQRILDPAELKGSRSVLRAAAMTYVASAAASILQLLRLILIFGGGRRRD